MPWSCGGCKDDENDDSDAQCVGASLWFFLIMLNPSLMMLLYIPQPPSAITTMEDPRRLGGCGGISNQHHCSHDGRGLMVDEKIL